MDILIVEDSEDMLWAEVNVLEKTGFTIDTVTTGREALEKLKESPETKLVVLDYLLPDMNGLTVMESFRANGCKAEVVVVSASARKEIRKDFLNSGAFAFLEKPFDNRELLKLCTQALKRRHVLQPDMPR